MMLKNATKRKNLVNNVKICKSILSKALGLMFRRKLKDDCIIFEFEDERTVALHMLFVFFAIDVLWLDKKKRVVEMKENFLPFTFYSPRKKRCLLLKCQKIQ